MIKRLLSSLNSNAKLWPYIVTTAGSLLSAFALSFFIIPYRIAPGGVSGIATVIYYISGGRLPPGITMILLNIPLFAVGLKKIGRRFLVRSIYGMIILSVFTDILSEIYENFKDQMPVMMGLDPANPDLLLFTLTGGMLMGAGYAAVLSVGASTGGTDIASKILEKKYPWIPLGRIMLAIDTVIVIVASVTFKSALLGLYALVCIYIVSKTIDAILEGISFARAIFIISSKKEEISARIMKEISRGVTSLKGTGMYTREPRDVLFCVADRRQLPYIKKLVLDIDPNAFIILTDVREVSGEGFKSSN